ncbi:glutathionylspermidine synthase family protein [Yinghuangia seranimata]|uniref:glutathionylspermidine synthase family protein n=1 Tax=Yinghuangia seranimata TaxID=408067 RepID=UPI00248B4A3E|nr:glutathionylspermidine synthase family protein [Yinghuangia seranimata]MDI2127630.1 glutathionylspermidine synthase family protein [Yinghuangia seranimata]
MERVPIDPRPDWRHLIESQGMLYAATRLEDGSEVPYWHEEAYYRFTLPEVEHLEEVTRELHEMCVAAARHILDRGSLAAFGLPEEARPYLRRTLDENHPSLYGRFDLAWGGEGGPVDGVKLLEYNADTPTTLIEASLIQWFWLRDRFPDRDQWNSLHERLVRAWARMTPALRSDTVHFAHVGGTDFDEEWLTASYLRDTAIEAGLNTVGLEVADIGWHDGDLRFVDLEERAIDTMFVLYPWEDMLTEPFGANVIAHPRSCLFVEPAWKVVLSNKALLATLWELYPGHPNLLPAYLDSPRELTSYVAKPLHGREGDSVRIVTPDSTYVHPTVDYDGSEGWCYQEYVPLPDLDGNQVVLGSWIVDGKPAGLGIRESDGPVTDFYARFVPHMVDTPAPTAEDRAAWLEEG